ncbi:hypothetical protein PES01_30220 [Pseudoalteromonas espejiana]|uniref:Mutator family transposase n=1 Tax=Pseudoalteromonas espejiana TaxID=28107 RepID=A0A510Y0G8_9GAMM|nr:hypothetical protein PES01_30220 [Pseudoalteromonas espejiana]
MNNKELEAFAKQAAKSIKTEADLTDFRKMLTKVTVEAALNAELDEHLGYARHEQASKDNYRSGYSPKTIRTEDGEVDLDAPRDRDSSFEPQLVKKIKPDSRQWIIRFYICIPKAWPPATSSPPSKKCTMQMSLHRLFLASLTPLLNKSLNGRQDRWMPFILSFTLIA